MKFFKQLILTYENSAQPKLKPQVMNESGTVWVIGYNHIIYGDYEYEQLKEGINQAKADQLLDEDIEQYQITLELEFNEFYGNQKFSQLNLGCQYLLLSLFYTTGRYNQFSKLIELCKKNQLYDALKFNNRKCLLNEEKQRQLQQYALEERKFFEQHFDSQGHPKNNNDWQQRLLQSTEDDLDYANQYVLSRYLNFQQYCIFAEINDYQFCNYKEPKWMEFVRDQEGLKYNYASYNEEQKKWFPVEVQDQERLIIGYSHVCTVEEEQYYKEGLTDGQVNYLFSTDYENNIIRVKRYLRQEFPQHEFENLQSWVQLFLIDISFRNYTFDAYQEAIKLALEGKQLEAISLSNINYPPSASVNTHYQERTEKLNDIFNQVQKNYSFKENQNNAAEKLLQLNNIVGIKITEGGYKFILNQEAKTKVNFKDLLTFLRIYYDPEFEDEEFDIYFSLDPELDDNEMQGQFQKKVYFPGYLEGTEVGEVLYESDFILKQMSLGIRSKGNQVEQFNYGGLNIQPIYERDPDFFNRIFLKIGNMKLNYVEDQSNKVHCLTIEHIDVTVDARTQGEDGEEHIIDDPNNAAQIFVDQFVQAYDQISQRYPVFQRLKEVLMANYLAKHMKRKNAQLNFESLDKLYQQILIPNYEQYKSPNLSMKFKLPDGFVEVTGGIDGTGINAEEKVEVMLQQIDTLKAYFVESENKQVTEVNLSRCSSIDSIQSVATEASIEDITDRRLCKCKKEIDIEGDLCKHCLKQQKCIKCQKVVSGGQQLKISDKLYCKDCVKCSQCNKQTPEKEIQQMGSYFSHVSCSQIKEKESKLKVGILEIIRKQLKTLDHKAAEMHFTCQKFECVEFKNYLDHVVGYHHFLVKDKIEYDPKKHKVLKSKAEQFLIEDFQKAQDSVAKLLIENGKKISDINENVLMLFISAAFIFENQELIKLFLTSAANNNYNNLYFDLQEFKCKQQKKHTCTIKNKISYILEFFNDRFHREDGRIREKSFLNIKNTFSKLIPSSRK